MIKKEFRLKMGFGIWLAHSSSFVKGKFKELTDSEIHSLHFIPKAKVEKKEGIELLTHISNIQV